MTTTYVLKSLRGSPLLSFDNESRTRDVQRERAKRGVNLRLVEVTTNEREIG